MDYFFNESSREEFSDFPFNCLTLVVSKPSQTLLLGMACGRTFRLCSISSLGTPGMSAGFHANMSRVA
jgi:hypothetical protein